MKFSLVQINIAKTIVPFDRPVMAKFVAKLDNKNALAENTDGLYPETKKTIITMQHLSKYLIRFPSYEYSV